MLEHGGGAIVNTPRAPGSQASSAAATVWSRRASRRVTTATRTSDPDGAGGVDPFKVFCDMETDGGGWTLILNRNVNSDNTRSLEILVLVLACGSDLPLLDFLVHDDVAVLEK